MSAFVVSKRHIDAMVTAALDGRHGMNLTWFGADGTRHEVTLATATETGAMLWATNVESVNYRYNDNEPLLDYSFESHDVPPVWVLKAIDCYEYQSCEHDGWKGSDASLFAEALRRHVVGMLPGYENAPWGIEAA
jgi:hypothetical protein